MKRTALITFLIISLNSISAQKLKDCIQQNVESLDINKEQFLENLQSNIGEEIKNKNFVLSGEIHTIWESEELRFKLFRSLNKLEGINHLIIESGSSKGYLLDKYLETKNESYLEKAFKKEGNEILVRRYKIWKRGLDELHELNKNKATADKTRVIGLDIERHGYEHLEFIFDEIKNKVHLADSYKKQISILLNLLNRTKSKKKVKKSFNVLYENIEIQKFLVNNSSYEDWILSNILRGLKYYISKKPYRQRDEFMYKSLLDYHKFEGFTKKYYYQTGINHMKLSKDWFARYILDDKEINGKIDPVLIRLEYFDFENNFYGNKFKKGELSMFKIEGNDLEKIFQESNIVWLNGRNCNVGSEIDYHILIRRK